MKKQFFTLLTMTCSLFAFSQVGILNNNPSATLDVSAQPTNLTKADGIIAPRLTGDQLRAKDSLYTTEQTGSLVYVTAAVTTTSPKTINVTSSGYYHYNGNIWVKQQEGSSGTVVGYDALLSGLPVPFVLNNTLAPLDMSLGSGPLTAWRTNNTTLTVPPGKAGKYMVSFTAGLKINGNIPNSYSFLIYLIKNDITISSPTTSIPATIGSNYTGQIFALSWSEIVDLNEGDKIRLNGLTYGTSGTPESFRLARISFERID
jgi:hypothetical protein